MPNRILRDYTDSFPMNELSADAERLFVRLITKADDFGRFHADPRLVKASCFPLKSEITEDNVTTWIMECQRVGVLVCYGDERGRKYVEIPNFKQRTRAVESKFPSPASCVTDTRPSSDSHPSASGQTPAHVFVFGDVVEDEVVVAPPKGRESLQSESDKLVEQILAAYPRPDSPNESRGSIEDAVDGGEDPQSILTQVQECAAYITSAPGGASNRFVPSAKSFFQGRQWRSPEVFRDRWKDMSKSTTNNHILPPKEGEVF